MLKHERVTRLLRQRIAKGVYPPGSRLPCETDLPRELRAGRQTVVRALNVLVHEGLLFRRRGDGTYVAHRERPPLLPGRHLKIGLIWPRSVYLKSIPGAFWGHMTRGLLAAWGVDPVPTEAKEVGKREVTRVVWTAPARGVTVTAVGESLYSHERHPPLRAIKEAGFDGLTSFSVIEEDWLEDVLALGLPTVLVDFPNERFAPRADQVYADPQTAYRTAVREMVARGARNLHFVGSTMVVAPPSPDMTHAEVVAFQRGKARIDPDTFVRLGAWRAAMEEAGLTAGDDRVHFDWPGEWEALVEKAAGLPAEQRPQGFVCHNLSQAERLMDMFAARGMPVLGAGASSQPRDGRAWSLFADGEALGRTAAELLLWKIKHPERLPLRVGVPMTLHRAAGETALQKEVLDAATVKGG
ncbi:MAG: GntR family transcriptional regulator [Planctomycetes bacterium]|nr:GntR family transcriptional regulator [Planctomycetota bacterium]